MDWTKVGFEATYVTLEMHTEWVKLKLKKELVALTQEFPLMRIPEACEDCTFHFKKQPPRREDKDSFLCVHTPIIGQNNGGQVLPARQVKW